MDKKPSFVIKNLNDGALNNVNIWTRREGWNPGLYDLKLFYEYQPAAFYGGFVDDKLICTGSALQYSNDFAFLGYYIVHPNYRHQKYGIALAKHLQSIVTNLSVGIDGVSNMASSYEEMGFKTQYCTTRYRFKKCRAADCNKFKVYDLLESNLEDIIRYDKKCVTYDRSRLLHSFIKQPDAITKAVIINNKILGYGVIRKSYEGWRVGPLVADSSEIAIAILQKLVVNTAALNIDIDLPDYNQDGAQIIREFAMQKLFVTNRMYLNQAQNILFNGVYGTMSLEVG